MRALVGLFLAGAALVMVSAVEGATPIRLTHVTHVDKPSFPRPVSRLRATGALRLVEDSTTRRAPGYVRTEGHEPDWAGLVGRLVGARFVRAFRQPGTTFGIYGTGIVVGVGPRGGLKYAFDLRSFGFPPRSSAPDAYGPQEVVWARQIGHTLVVQTNHLGHAKDSGNQNGYLTGIDLDRGTVRWRSPSLVANAQNFIVVRGMIVSGYGFTAEKDWLYLVDPATGRVRDRLALPSAAERISLRGDRIAVRAYDAWVVARLVPA